MHSEAARGLCEDGNRQYQEGRFWEAIESYTKAMEVKGEDTHLLSNRSAAYLNLRKGELALSDARRCIELRPEWAKGYVKAALAMRLLGQFGEATVMLEKASEISPHDQYIRVLEKAGTSDELLHMTFPEKASSSPMSQRSAHPPAKEAYSIPRTRGVGGLVQMTQPVAVPVVDVVTRQDFSCVRRLSAPQLSDEENTVLYGKDTTIHGCTFTLETVLRGSVSPATGYVITPSCLTAYLHTAVLDILDHKHLDADLPYFAQVVPTTENLAAFIWSSLQEAMSPAHRPLLHEVRLWNASTPHNTVTFRGEYRQAPPKGFLDGMAVM